MASNSRLARNPNRPAIPVAFGCGCLFWLSCSFAYSNGQFASSGECALIAAAILLVIPISSVIAIRLNACAIALFTAVLLLGLSYGFASAYRLHVDYTLLHAGEIAHVTCTAIDDSKPTGTGERVFCKAHFGDGSTLVLLVTFNEGDPLYCGQRFEADLSVKIANWSDDAYLWQNGAVARAYAGTYRLLPASMPVDAMMTMRETVINSLSDETEEGAFLQAVVCGYRHDVSSTALYASFQKCGLAHLVAVSGAHLSIVTALMASFMKALGAPRWLVICASVIAMVSYLVLSGAPISGIRAAIMAAMTMSSYFAKRRPYALNALGVGILAIVIASPRASVSPSFALSALSTIGIVLFAPLFRHWINRSPLKRVSFAADALALTLSAGFLSMPYACSVFNQLPLIAPFANIVCMPLFPVVCLSGLICGMLSGMGASFGSALTSICEGIVGLLEALAGFISEMPLASIPVSIDTRMAILATIGASVSMWLAWPILLERGAFRTLTCSAMIAVVLIAGVSPLVQRDCIIMLDVGQGDAFLIKSRGHALLIDTGNLDSQLIDQLAQSSTFSLDAVLITHNDDDHCGSLDALERAIHVDRALLHSGLLASCSEKNEELVHRAQRTADEVVGLNAGDRMQIGAFTAYVIWPVGIQDDGGNADSICLLVSYDEDDDGVAEFNVLFTGDAEKEELRTIIEDKGVSAVDMLKVGHHGSKNAFTSDELDVLDPSIALISVGANNRYGHPAKEVMEMLDERNCRVYRSDIDGQVTCLFSRESMSVVLQ